VLADLTETLGVVPLVLLRDASETAGPDPVVTTASAEMPNLAERQGHLQLLGEIAHGGMGAVLKGRDVDLGRDLAVKVLLERHGDDPDLIRRFVEEAQIGGQLQHPGIVPVYELGAFSDRRPYIAMKLVKGCTLAALLSERPSPSDGLPRLVGIFEQICQTVAYAHVRGVIHRDLKPLNVMVGSFGEVQVMDWGLAKVLPRVGVADDERAGEERDRGTVIATARSGGRPDLDASRAGSVLGTPSYMAPEQARGEIDRIDERADVFALGAILCEVLTGQPAFTGRTSGEIQRKAARADTAEALRRLDACGADAELVALARACLGAEPEDRPRDALAVSERVSAHLTGVQERLRAAEIERARAEARAAEERRRRRLQLGLAASLLALTTLGGLGFTYALNQRQARAARIDRMLAGARLLRDEARARREDVARWERAREALERTAEELGPSAVDPLATLRQEVRAGLEAAEADRSLLGQLVDIRSAQADDPDGSATDASYARAFADAGIDPDRGDPAGAGARVAGRPAPVATALVAALDNWAAVRRRWRATGSGWARVVAVARTADPDADRDALRAALLVEDTAERRGRLRPLVERADTGSWAPASLVLLGESLAGAGDVDAGVAVLRRASWSHPEDARAHFALAQVLGEVRPPQPEEIIRTLSVTWSRQPELAGHDLAHALDKRGRGAEAGAIWRDLVGRRPNDGRHLGCYGRHLKELGRGAEAAPVFDRAIAALREAIRLRPDYHEARNILGNVLLQSGDLPGAVAASREAVRQKPDCTEAYTNLGVALSETGDLPGAVAALREATRLQPDYSVAHINLGVALAQTGDLPGALAALREAIRLRPDSPEAHTNLGSVLANMGDLPGALAALREAIRLRPDVPVVHYNLGKVQLESGDLPGAVTALREAIRLRPDYPDARTNLGNALLESGDLPGAVAAYRDAIRLRPVFPLAHYNLGNALLESGDLPGAVTAYREAVRQKPDYAEAHGNLGGALRQQGQYAESLAEYRLGHELGSKRPGWSYPSAQWVAEAEKLAALAERFPAILRGTAKPADSAERLAFAQMFYNTKRYAGAARLWSEALESDPNVADDRKAQHRYSAACAAALAGLDQGEDDPKPDAATRARLRGQALDWLQTERADWAKVLDADGAQAHSVVTKNLRHWQADADLAGVRDRDALAKLPADERRAWEALWVDVAALVNRAARPGHTESTPGGATRGRQDGATAESRPSAPPRESVAVATSKPDDAGTLDHIHKRAHELAPSKPAEAESLFRQALEGYRMNQGPDGALTLDLTLDLANLLDQAGRGPEAEPLFRAGLEAARKRFGADHPRTAGIMAVRGLILIQRDKWREAEPILRECLAIREKVQPDEWTTFNTSSLLGGSLLGQKKYAEAEPLLRKGYEGMKAREEKIPKTGGGELRIPEALDRLIELHTATNNPDEVTRWQSERAKYPATAPPLGKK
jgi:serine/threonine-protein kinase